eukprot:1159095-Pelagomonas_calceolata.AAC.2
MVIWVGCSVGGYYCWKATLCLVLENSLLSGFYLRHAQLLINAREQKNSRWQRKASGLWGGTKLAKG